MKDIINILQESSKAEIHIDPIHRRIYSVDASIYEVEPFAIAIPKTKEDIIQILRIAFDAGIPVIPRGAATGITGGCLGKGIIIDLSKYLNHILEINVKAGYALCEPGVVQDRLNEALKPLGYRLGPDTSTGNRATLGGMLANNSAGARSLYYGCMAEHVQEVELALAGGKLMRFTNKSDLKGNEPIYQVLRDIRENLADEIKARFPKIPRRVSGYNLDCLLQNPVNLCKLIAGSEGTFGIATEIKVDLAPLPPKTMLSIIHFKDMVEGMKIIPEIMKHKPISFEMIDDKILEMARQSPAVKDKLGWLVNQPKMVFVVESEKKLDNFGYATTVITDEKMMQHVWDVRKAGLGLLLSKRTYSRAIAFIEDISLPPEKLVDFIPFFLSYLKTKGKEAGIYGHVGSGCLHIRPYIDLRKPEEAKLMQTILTDVAEMLLAFGGALSGEHGDGLVRSWLNEKMFGPTLYQAFKQVKGAFDPRNLMNPEKIVNGPSFLGNLRTKGEPYKIETFLNFNNEGGFDLAVDMCNGNGMCRKKEGTMCPSFQATEDEYDTTRARAQALRGIITGRAPIEDLSSQEVYDVLDLCLECKGCKKECPSLVDMAKIKSEVLYHYHKQHGHSIRSRIFANIPELFDFAAPLSSIVNWINQSTPGKWLLNKVGISNKRELPKLAPVRFSRWFAKYKQTNGLVPITLFNDTFTEFNHPEIGIAAVKVLNHLGYKVHLLPWKCCGRPLISKGFLEKAKKQAEEVYYMISDDHPIIVLEPSCLSALTDDYLGLIGRKLDNCISFDAFIANHLPLNLTPYKGEILLHGHCHQKALYGTSNTMKILETIPQAKIKEISSGCCGMAGSFGYESEHYDLSMKIGQLKLFPAIKQTNACVVADGTSCRTQILHGTNRKALHLAEMLNQLFCL